MPVHNWPVGVPWLASGMEPEHWSRDFAETKRAEIFRGAIVRTPIPRWNRCRTAIGRKDLYLLPPLGPRRSSIPARSTGFVFRDLGEAPRNETVPR